MVRVNVAPDEFVRRLTDIVDFKKAPAVLQIGTFSFSTVSQGTAISSPTNTHTDADRE